MSIAVPTNLGIVFFISNGAATSFTLTTLSAITAGGLAVVSITTTNTGAAVTVTSVSDGTNAYSRSASFSDGAAVNTTQEIWTIANAAAVGAGATITVNLSSAPTTSLPQGAIACMTTGVATSSPFDQTANASASSATNVSMTTAALALNAEIVFGAAYSITSTTLVETEQNSFLNINRSASASGLNITLNYYITNGTTGVTFNPTWDSAHQMGGIEATFKGPPVVFPDSDWRSEQMVGQRSAKKMVAY